MTPANFTIPAAAKAYIALIGVVATALLSKFTDGNVSDVLQVIVIVATAITTWAVPNADVQKGGDV